MSTSSLFSPIQLEGRSIVNLSQPNDSTVKTLSISASPRAVRRVSPSSKGEKKSTPPELVMSSSSSSNHNIAAKPSLTTSTTSIITDLLATAPEVLSLQRILEKSKHSTPPEELQSIDLQRSGIMYILHVGLSQFTHLHTLNLSGNWFGNFTSPSSPKTPSSPTPASIGGGGGGGGDRSIAALALLPSLRTLKVACNGLESWPSPQTIITICNTATTTTTTNDNVNNAGSSISGLRNSSPLPAATEEGGSSPTVAPSSPSPRQQHVISYFPSLETLELQYNSLAKYNNKNIHNNSTNPASQGNRKTIHTTNTSNTCLALLNATVPKLRYLDISQNGFSTLSFSPVFSNFYTDDSQAHPNLHFHQHHHASTHHPINASSSSSPPPIFPHLEELKADGNRCSRIDDLLFLSHLPKLRHLSLANNYFDSLPPVPMNTNKDHETSSSSATATAHISFFDQLESLSLAYNYIPAGADLATLMKIPQLRTVHLFGTPAALAAVDLQGRIKMAEDVVESTGSRKYFSQTALPIKPLSQKTIASIHSSITATATATALAASASHSTGSPFAAQTHSQYGPAASASASSSSPPPPSLSPSSKTDHDSKASPTSSVQSAAEVTGTEKGEATSISSSRSTTPKPKKFIPAARAALDIAIASMRGMSRSRSRSGTEDKPEEGEVLPPADIAAGFADRARVNRETVGSMYDLAHSIDLQRSVAAGGSVLDTLQFDDGNHDDDDKDTGVRLPMLAPLSVSKTASAAASTSKHSIAPAILMFGPPVSKQEQEKLSIGGRSLKIVLLDPSKTAQPGAAKPKKQPSPSSSQRHHRQQQHADQSYKGQHFLGDDASTASWWAMGNHGSMEMYMNSDAADGDDAYMSHHHPHHHGNVFVPKSRAVLNVAVSSLHHAHHHGTSEAGKNDDDISKRKYTDLSQYELPAGVPAAIVPASVTSSDARVPSRQHSRQQEQQQQHLLQKKQHSRHTAPPLDMGSEDGGSGKNNASYIDPEAVEVYESITGENSLDAKAARHKAKRESARKSTGRGYYSEMGGAVAGDVDNLNEDTEPAYDDDDGGIAPIMSPHSPVAASPSYAASTSLPSPPRTSPSSLFVNSNDNNNNKGFIDEEKLENNTNFPLSQIDPRVRDAMATAFKDTSFSSTSPSKRQSKHYNDHSPYAHDTSINKHLPRPQKSSTNNQDEQLDRELEAKLNPVPAPDPLAAFRASFASSLDAAGMHGMAAGVLESATSRALRAGADDVDVRSYDGDYFNDNNNDNNNNNSDEDDDDDEYTAQKHNNNNKYTQHLNTRRRNVLKYTDGASTSASSSILLGGNVLGASTARSMFASTIGGGGRGENNDNGGGRHNDDDPDSSRNRARYRAALSGLKQVLKSNTSGGSSGIGGVVGGSSSKAYSHLSVGPTTAAQLARQKPRHGILAPGVAEFEFESPSSAPFGLNSSISFDLRPSTSLSGNHTSTYIANSTNSNALPLSLSSQFIRGTIGSSYVDSVNISRLGGGVEGGGRGSVGPGGLLLPLLSPGGMSLNPSATDALLAKVLHIDVQQYRSDSQKATSSYTMSSSSSPGNRHPPFSSSPVSKNMIYGSGTGSIPVGSNLASHKPGIKGGNSKQKDNFTIPLSALSIPTEIILASSSSSSSSSPSPLVPSMVPMSRAEAHARIMKLQQQAMKAATTPSSSSSSSWSSSQSNSLLAPLMRNMTTTKETQLQKQQDYSSSDVIARQRHQGGPRMPSNAAASATYKGVLNAAAESAASLASLSQLLDAVENPSGPKNKHGGGRKEEEEFGEDSLWSPPSQLQRDYNTSLRNDGDSNDMNRAREERILNAASRSALGIAAAAALS